MRSASSLSYLDRKIKLAFDFSCNHPLNDDAGEMFLDVVAMVDDTRSRRPFGQKIFIARSKILLMVLGKLRPHLTGKSVQDLDAIEGMLLSAVTQKDGAGS